MRRVFQDHVHVLQAVRQRRMQRLYGTQVRTRARLEGLRFNHVREVSIRVEANSSSGTTQGDQTLIRSRYNVFEGGRLCRDPLTILGVEKYQPCTSRLTSHGLRLVCPSVRKLVIAKNRIVMDSYGELQGGSYYLHLREVDHEGGRGRVTLVLGHHAIGACDRLHSTLGDS